MWKKLLFKNFLKNIRFFLIVLVATFFSSSLLYLILGARMIEIGMYEKTKFDYVISACSYEQISEMKKESCFGKILPWKSLSDSELSRKNMTIGEVGLIILENQNISFDEALEMTFYSRERNVERGIVNEKSVFIDRDIQEKLKLNIGDELLVSISENDKIKLEVGGVFENTSYSDKYTCMIFYTESVRQIFEKTYGTDWLSGAYILGTNKKEIEEYFIKNPYYPGQYFIDMGKDKNRAERIELNKVLKHKDWSKLVDDRIKNVDDYSENGTYNNSVIILSTAVAILISILSMVLFTFRYIKGIQITCDVMFSLGENRTRTKFGIFSFIWLSLIFVTLLTVLSSHMLFVGMFELINGFMLTVIMLVIGLFISFFSVFIGISVGYLKSSRI